MNKRNLHPKRALCFALFVLLLSAVGMTKAFAQQYESYWPDFYYQDYENQSVFVAAIMIDGQIIYNTTEGWDALEVAAFVGNECRGNNNYLYDGYVQEYGDPFPILDGISIYYTSSLETVTFKMYDHMNGILYEDCEVIYNGEPITVFTGEDHVEGWYDFENPIFLSFTTSTQGTHWPEFSNDFSNQAGIVAAIMIDGQIVNTTTEGWDVLEVAAFVGDECRANEMYLYDGYVQDYGDPFPVLDGLSIYYDTPNEVVSFKMFNHLNEIEYDSCTILYNGEPITILTGEDHFEGWDDPEHPIMLNFTTPELNSYEISVTANPDEGGTVNGAGTYYHGQYCTLTALANEGSTFHYWTENGEVVSFDVEYTFLVKRDRNLVADFSSNSPIIFADANVKALCVANWDTDGDGELSYAEASEVTSLGEVFRSKYSISSFDELQYFTGLTSIGNYAFYYCKNLTSIVLPSSVTSIGNYAFYSCQGLTGSLTIPNSVTTIGGYAFSGCSGLTSLTIGDSVTSIGDYAFNNCSGLNAVYYMGNVSQWCSIQFGSGYGSNPLYYAHNLYIDNELVTDLVIPETVTELKPYVFYGCSCLISVTIGNSVTSIGYDAFSHCIGLTSLTIGNSVTSIGNNPFSYCSHLEQIVVESSNTVYDSRENCNAIIETATNTLVSGCKNTVISYSVTAIGLSAFAGCSGLAGNFTIPCFVTTIGEDAFCGCNGLTSIVLPYSVTSVEHAAFDQCSGLVAVYYTGDISQWCNIQFADFGFPEVWDDLLARAGGEVADFPSNPLYYAHNLYIGNELVTDLVIPETVTEIKPWTFINATCLTSLTIGNSVTSIGQSAFEDCSGLTSITVFAETPPSCYYAFYNVNKSIPVYVPTGTISAYQTASGWSEFTNFMEIPNHWTPNVEDYEDNMTFTCVVEIDGEEQRSTMLEVGAFCGEECRGSQRATYFAPTDRYIIQMTVFGEGNDVISFRLYDHQQQAELPLNPPAGVAFSNNGYGSLSNPYVLNFTSSVTHTQPLNNGWNWWSTYVELNNNDGLSQLENSIGSNGLVIKSRTNGYVEAYDDNGITIWYGTLNSINNEQMYKIRTNAACEATVVGVPAVPENHPISINSGWNWIGFPCNQNVSVDVAMSNFTPENNDVIKGRTGFTTYYSDNNYNMWYGTLNILEVGKGYMYRSNSTTQKTLVFQTGRGETTMENVTTEDNIFQPADENFADNMTVTAVLELDGEELRSDDYELAAFVGDECRGSVRLMYVEPVNRYVAFLTVFGEPSETLYFRLTDGTQTEMSMDEITFAADGMEGTLSEPMTLRFGTTKLDENEWSKVLVYPNPSNGVFNIQGQGIRKIEVFNAFGQAVVSEETSNDHLQIDLSRYADGCYMLRVVTDNGISNRQLIKK